ncbi:glycosyltransferase [Aerosakkonemataceae cyanobacterium BLCC-F154]|uniref:Glycosyltransferase n=1 Tax=Floridaenema fluviatile BLCC-F154 TaxID=3153640 RepID=A0ABV4YJA9_9CYAN
MSTSVNPWKTPKLYLNLLALLSISACGFAGLYYFSPQLEISVYGGWAAVSVGTLGAIRWSWFGFHLLRGWYYRKWVFARWRRKANRIPLEDLPTACLIAPTFKEKPWITDKVFRAIANNAKSLINPTIVIVVTTPEEIEAIGKILEEEDPEHKYIKYMPMLDPAGGKRKALAEGLRLLARSNPPKNTIVGLMDGDAVINPGVLKGCLPFFNMFPKMGALTTDERATVLGSKFFEEWLVLRFAQRHLYMCSHGLSKKVLCLTGRFSLYRAEAALNPTFADLLEKDMLNDWLWGEFKFLSGDDKSTWYWVLKEGYDMMYIPDAMVDTIETISGSVPMRAYQNMRRWFGNMLRNGSRALLLGPNKVGWFIWYCIIDQRLSIWTALIAPGLMIIYALTGDWIKLGLIFSWLTFTRALSLIIFSLGRDDYLRPIHLIYMLASQWSSSLIKIYTQMNLAKQKWSNRGNQKTDIAGTGFGKWLKLSTSSFLYYAQLFGFAIFLCSMAKVFSPPDDLPNFWWHANVQTKPAPMQIVKAINYGILPNDGKDDGAALQKLIASLPQEGLIQVNLPIGELDLFQPVEINRSNIIIKGQGAGRTVIKAHVSRKVPDSFITIKPPNFSKNLMASSSQIETVSEDNSSIPTLINVELSRFSLEVVPPKESELNYKVDSIVLDRVEKAALKNIQFEQSQPHALVLNNTQGVNVEYIAIEGNFDCMNSSTVDSHQESLCLNEQIAQKNAVNTVIKGINLPTGSS